MCGIAGFISNSCTMDDLLRMGNTLTHRGPDQTGYFYKKNTGLISKRLSIVDVKDGKQPAYSESGQIVVILNGEIYNYVSLRCELEMKGHRISNNSDTAILPHLYEEYGTEMFRMLSGQFAIAIYDEVHELLLLARDRIGIIPLYYYCKNNEFQFGSEIKALLASGRITREINCSALQDIFTFWSPQHDRTIFKGIASLLPGEYCEIQKNTIKRKKYYLLKFEDDEKHSDFDSTSENIETLLCSAVQKRLMGDVKVSTYLSGGLDSSLITSIIANKFDSNVETFSVGFEDNRLDESQYQKLVCDRFGIKHNSIIFKNSDIPGLIKEIIWHTETPLLRAGPIPLYKLSQLVNQNNIKVVLSGEGADEFFGGYDIFREVKIKSYLKKYPNSDLRKVLLKKINQFSIRGLQDAPVGGLSYFYRQDDADNFFGSHIIRWRQFSFFERFLSYDVLEKINDTAISDYYKSLELDCPDEIQSWTDIQRSQYLEITTFLSRYLLSSQGDRISMANSVEVRFPFLDDELIKCCMSLKDTYKISGLNEKYILKSIASKYLPEELINRQKFPYRSAPDYLSIISDPYLSYLLSEESINRYNVFNSQRIRKFIDEMAGKDEISERETMLLMGVLTTQVLCDIFNMLPI